MKRTAIALGLLLSASATVVAQTPSTLTLQSHAKASAVLDAAVVAIGGAEALQEIRTVRLELDGETWPRNQMPTPEPPFDAGHFNEKLLFDLTTNSLLLEQRVAGAGFEGHNATVIKGGEGANYDLRGRTTTPIPAGQTNQQQFIQYYRRLPNLILIQALGRPTSLRHLGETNYEGRKHDVITFVMPDTQQVAIYVDAQNRLISKYELIFADPLDGNTASEIIFSDYAQSGKLKVPRIWSWRIAGDLVASYKVKTEFNPAVTDDSFNVASAGFTTVPPAGPNPEASVEKLADGVFVLHNVAGPNQNTLAVEFKDYILAVEAPGDSAGGERVIARIRETIPGKPVRYVVLTHHHGDHVGGLRSFIAEGATVITTKSNRRVVETLARAPQNDRLARTPRAPQFEFVEEGRRRFTDGEQVVELVDVGPNPHAREMIVAYLPKHRIVFQGDLFRVPDNGAPYGPPQSSTLSFAKSLKSKGMIVDRIASVHGPTATFEEFQTATGSIAEAGGRR